MYVTTPVHNGTPSVTHATTPVHNGTLLVTYVTTAQKPVFSEKQPINGRFDQNPKFDEHN